MTEHRRKADQDAEQKREVPVDCPQRVNSNHTRHRQHADGNGGHPARIDMMKRLRDKARKQTDTYQQRDFLIS
jgi:hypothetical protein